MLVDINKIDKGLAARYAFSELLNALDMDFVFSDEYFSVHENEATEELAVYIEENGEEKIYDDRGELFVALRNLANCMFPNLDFRSDDYIFDFTEIYRKEKENI